MTAKKIGIILAIVVIIIALLMITGNDKPVDNRNSSYITCAANMDSFTNESSVIFRIESKDVNESILKNFKKDVIYINATDNEGQTKNYTANIENGTNIAKIKNLDMNKNYSFSVYYPGNKVFRASNETLTVTTENWTKVKQETYKIQQEREENRKKVEQEKTEKINKTNSTYKTYKTYDTSYKNTTSKYKYVYRNGKRYRVYYYYYYV